MKNPLTRGPCKPGEKSIKKFPLKIFSPYVHRPQCLQFLGALVMYKQKENDKSLFYNFNNHQLTSYIIVHLYYDYFHLKKLQFLMPSSFANAVGPDLLHGNLHFARQFRCFLGNFKFQLTMKNPRIRKNGDVNVFALIFKIPKLSFNTKFDKICGL